MGTGTELGRVRGLGTAKSGTHHWWQQRVTALGNLALVVWFVISLVRLPNLTYPTIIAWLQQPIAAVPLVLMIVSVFYHFRLGAQGLVEDYVHEGSKVLALLLLNFFALALGFTAVFSVLKIAFGAV